MKKLCIVLLLCIPTFLIGAEHDIITTNASGIYFTTEWTAPSGEHINHFRSSSSGGYLYLTAKTTGGSEKDIITTSRTDVYFVGNWTAPDGVYINGFTTSVSGGFLYLTAKLSNGGEKDIITTSSDSIFFSAYNSPGEWLKGFTSSSGGGWLDLTAITESANQPPNEPSTPSGTASGYTGVSYSYSTSTTDPDGDSVKYTFNWDDGDSTVTGFYASGATANASHTWTSAGTYNVRVKATDIKGASSSLSFPFPVDISEANNPPNTPSIPTGPTTGYILNFYEFSTSATDPDGDSIYYIFDWGDGVQTQTNLLPSGLSGYYAHSWTGTAPYSISAKAIDKFGAESGWSSPATITISEISDSANWFCYVNSNSISGLAMEWDVFWVGARDGIVRWDLFDSSYVKYTTVNGLGDNIVKDVYVDEDGNKWFGTSKGVTKFDGTSWITYNTSNSGLPGNVVYAITQDSSGNYWFGTGFGCAKFDGVIWTAYTDLGGGATDVAVRGIAVDTLDRIWTANNPNSFGDPGGVSMFDGSIWTNWDLDASTWQDDYLLCLNVDGQNQVWAGTWLKWVYMYNGSSWTHYDDVNSGLLGQQIEAIEVEKDTIIWFANHRGSGATNDNSGVSKYDGNTWTNYTPNNSGLVEKQIFDIAIDTLNNLYYFGAATKGVSSFDGSSIWKNYKTSNEPHCNYISSIDASSTNKIFLGTAYYGVITYDGVGWSSYTTDNSGLGDNYINVVYLDDGDTLWIGSQYSGIWEFDGVTWTNYDTVNSGLLGNIILSLDKASDNVLWIGTAGWDGPLGQDGALCRYDGSAWTNYYLQNSGLIDDDGLIVKVDRVDTVWVGTEEGISKFDGSSWTNYDTGNSGLVHDYILSVAIDSMNNKWFGTKGGVSKFDGTSWQNWTTADGLPSNEITGISIYDSDMVWVSTPSGAAVFNDTEWLVYHQEDSLVDDDLTCVFVDDNKDVWFGSDKSGIGKYTGVIVSIVTEDENPFIHNGRLLSVYPNPFTEKIAIRIQALGNGKNTQVKLKIFDVNGRLIKEFSPSISDRGGPVVEAIWDGTDGKGYRITTGIYFLHLECGRSRQTEKLILIR